MDAEKIILVNLNLRRKQFLLLISMLVGIGGIAFWWYQKRENLLPAKEIQFIEHYSTENDAVKSISILQNNLQTEAQRYHIQNAKLLEITLKIVTANQLAQNLNQQNKKSTQLYSEGIALAEKANHIQLTIWCRLQYAYYLYTFRNYTSAASLISLTTKEIDQNKKLPLINAADTYKKLGYIFSTLRDYEKSNFYLEKAIHQLPNNSAENADLEDNIGVNFLKLGNVDTAILRFNSALKQAKKTGNKIRFAKVLGNIALVEISKKNYERAIALLEKDITISEQLQEKKNKMYAQTLLGKIYILTSKYGLAEKTLKEANETATSQTYYKSEQLEILNQLRALAEIQQQPLQELRLWKKISAIQNEVNSLDGEPQISAIHNQLEKENFELQLSIIKAKQEKSRYINILLSALTVLLFFSIYLLRKLATAKLSRAQEKNQQKILQLQVNQLTIEKNLNKSNKTIHEYKQYLLEKTEQIENLQKELENLPTKEHPHLQKDSLEALLQSHLMTTENWNSFKEAYQNEYPEDYHFLKQNFSDLTESNLRIVLLSRLDLTNHDMAQILGVTLDAVKKAKQRLRKKYDTSHHFLFKTETIEIES